MRIEIWVPDCYGTLEEGNRNCTDPKCSAYKYCREKTVIMKEKGKK